MMFPNHEMFFSHIIQPYFIYSPPPKKLNVANTQNVVIDAEAVGRKNLQ